MEGQEKDDRFYKKRNRLFMDFDLTSDRNPRENNKYIFIFLLLIILGGAVYVASFYW